MEIDDTTKHPSTHYHPRWTQMLSTLPDKLHERLMPFQKEGVQFALSRNGRCMIADEMGLGKTLQALAVAVAYREEWPLLVVVPSSLKYLWMEEMERWIPDLNPGDINLVENKSDTTGISSSKVTVLGYGLLTTDARPLVEALTRQRFQVVVVDESHYLKSRSAARSKILVPLIQSAKRAVLLTGTPALGRPEELFMQVEALYPKKFGTWSDYTKQYCNAHYRYFGGRRQWDSRGASNLAELHRRLGDIMIRRLKEQVLPQLPPKIRQRIPFDPPKDAAKEAYASFEEWERLMRSRGSGVVAADNPFTEVMGLVTRMYKQTAIAKAGAVKDYIKMLLETEKIKFLVFAHHLTMLQACTEAAIEAKASYIRIDGSVPSSERVQLVHQFQNQPETRVAILSIQAAGQGLTFTAASHVVFAELYWNPGHVKQAEDRAHRIGQVSSVHVHYLIAKGTFDTVMWGMLNRKETVTGSTLNGKKENLNAEVGDRDKWDFLNLASAWTPSEMVLVGDAAIAEDNSLFFSHFERDKQHDIRSFFSPGSTHQKKKKKKRQREEEVIYLDDEEEEKEQTPKSASRKPAVDDQDFSPQVKRLRTPLGRPTPRSRFGGKRKSCPRALGSSPLLSPLFAPRRLPLTAPNQRKMEVEVTEWSCLSCTYSNSKLLPYCEMCESPRPSPTSASSSSLAPEQQDKPSSPSSPGLPLSSSNSPSGRGDDDPTSTPETRRVTEGKEEEKGHEDREEVAPSCASLYPDLQFCASRNTERIHLYAKGYLNGINLQDYKERGGTLNTKLGHLKESLVVRFVREWSSLTAMKQKLLRRSSWRFTSPLLALDQLASSQHKHSSTKRYLTREDVAQASFSKAQSDGGSVRLVTKETFFAKRRSASLPAEKPEGGPSGQMRSPPARPLEVPVSEPGYVQAVDSRGVPLCLSCQQPCVATGGPWDTRFCSQSCQEEFQLRSSQSYMRARVLQTEQGVCQQCGLQAHQLYLQVRDAPPAQRKEMLGNTWLAQLSLKQLNEMIRNPVEGHFWQVDHIRPVYSGGGQCSLDNLQTLCTVCHKTRTSHQAKERSQMKKWGEASKVASDISRFFIKK
ncbi:DNA annealing helicase and endonuclease ZRANB3 [Aplochiton taeniatus]